MVFFSLRLKDKKVGGRGEGLGNNNGNNNYMYFKQTKLKQNKSFAYFIELRIQASLLGAQKDHRQR